MSRISSSFLNPFFAVDEPSRYALLYGSPVPGYAAPPEVTIEPGTRVIGILLGLVAAPAAYGMFAPLPAVQVDAGTATLVVAGLLYLVITLPLSQLVRRLEIRHARAR